MPAPMPPGTEFLGWLLLLAAVGGIVFLIIRCSSPSGTATSANPRREDSMSALLEEIKLLREEIRELREELKE
ncbi:hypothetical protein [Thermococcus sp. ES12]|uniref:hypothetical protein n=1 Tax=Thermococcus sp. ES12 TaxID=1638246 RepID=UPI001431D94C|nr:hypothetical protein [Thermococcus sp. ES12]NJE75721.1 hypothetical protein [Thermococcus sp. ES12]